MKRILNILFVVFFVASMSAQETKLHTSQILKSGAYNNQVITYDSLTGNYKPKTVIGLTGGLANRVGIWTGANSMSYDDELSFVSGKLGLGLSTQTAKLQIEGDGVTASTFSFLAQDAMGISIFGLKDDGSTHIYGESFWNGDVNYIGDNSIVNQGDFAKGYIRMFSDGIIMNGGTNWGYIRFDTGVRLNGDRVVSTSSGELFSTYNSSFDGIPAPLVRNSAVWVFEGNTNPSVISRSNIIYRIDSNNDGASNFFSIEHDSGTELMRVNESAQVGIGTSTPSANVDVVGDIEVSVRTGTAITLAGWGADNKSADVVLSDDLQLVDDTLSVEARNFISFHDFKALETVANKAVGDEHHLVTSNVSGRKLVELRGLALTSVSGSIDIEVRINGIAQGSGITVTGSTAVSEILDVELSTNDVISLSYSSSSGTLVGLFVSIGID